MEIGIDLEQSERFKNKDLAFFKKVFAPEEIAYAEKQKYPHEHYCVFWCVKEAVIKAFGEKKLSPLNICTIHDESGKPYIKMNNLIKNELEKRNLTEIKISLSHTKDYGTAVCVIC